MGGTPMKIAAGIVALVLLLTYLGGEDREAKIRAECDEHGVVYLEGKVYNCQAAVRVSRSGGILM